MSHTHFSVLLLSPNILQKASSSSGAFLTPFLPSLCQVTNNTQSAQQNPQILGDLRMMGRLMGLSDLITDRCAAAFLLT